MTLAELKIELIQKIIAIDDEVLLMKINEILDSRPEILNEANEPSTVYQKSKKVLILNEWQQERINIALKQFENGEYITEEEASIEMEKWFKEEEKRLIGQ